MPLPLAVERVDESLGLREPLTAEQATARKVAENMTVPTAAQNDQALAQLTKMMGGL